MIQKLILKFHRLHYRYYKYHKFSLKRYCKHKLWSAIIQLCRWRQKNIPDRPSPVCPPYGGWLTDAESEAWYLKANLIFQQWKAEAPKLTWQQQIRNRIHRYCIRILYKFV